MSETEAETRRELIDVALGTAGWDVDDPSQVVKELDIYLSAEGVSRLGEQDAAYGDHTISDYGLRLGERIAAVVEAKRTSKDARLGQEQALQYAQDLQRIQGDSVPLVFYTNGHKTHLWESEFYPPELVHGFPTRDDLDWMVQRQASRRPLSVELIDSRIAGRDYQIAAVRSVLEGIESKRRKFLLVMATGTGKTRVAIALADALFRARWAKRVLFLVDRIALQAQALDAFKEHMSSEPRWPRSEEREFTRDRRVYVSTYPTMLNLIEEAVPSGSGISPYFFDVVIADESHRSIYNTYLQVLDYFSAIKLGLTATPKDHVDHDTFKLFDCDQHDPTFAYAFDEAIAHDPPYLCDFEVLRVRSKFQLEGIKGQLLPPSVQRRLVAEGRDVSDIDFEGTDLERKVTNAGTNSLIIREFMEECIKDPSGVLPGKTIFFAISIAHARRLQSIFDMLYPEYRGRLARVLVSEDSRVHGKGGLFDQFKNRDMPRVAISVDMLDTGVDVHEVVNLVFAKPVYSYVKFWQMIGRGTRILDPDPTKRRPWCPEKDRFLIIDCWANFEYFEMTPKGREPGAQEALPVRLFRSRLDKLEAALAVGRQDIVERVKRELRADIDALPRHNVVVSSSSSVLSEVGDDRFWARLTVDRMGILRTEVAPVLRVRSGADHQGMRFEAEIVELGIALLSGHADTFDALRESVTAKIADLPLSVNVVAEHKDLIASVQTDDWWECVTDEDLSSLADSLGPLMQYRQSRSSAMLELDITDLTVIKERFEFGPDHERLTSSVYRAKVEAFIRELVEENLVLQKIRAGEEVSEKELGELAELLESQGPRITEDVLRRAYGHPTAGFVQFMRHILGLEALESWSEIVTQAFDQFIVARSTLSEVQIRFLRTLRTFVLQTGGADRSSLIELPFTRIHPEGVRGVFGREETREILEMVTRVRHGSR